MTPAERLRAAIDKLEQLRAGAEPVVGYDVKARAELIVTLHRTIDAQLAILRHAALDTVSPDEPAALDDALDLADVILGEP